ncbi:hypothetical protein PORY_002132 [Pneumocystis oryctolagi]|uniref:Uncharacterized protein n=1 Tax=Pneumocystis oryctolagi TaxID=42067 RepID=A0ACB7CD52_9ASCO|nr:hypothetical protein PORY_002132 [Pneumocystis oryctolagi]
MLKYRLYNTSRVFPLLGKYTKFFFHSKKNELPITTETSDKNVIKNFSKMRKDFREYKEKGIKRYGFDDITSLAYDYLNEHREIREYYRKIAWELPTLPKFSIPYEPPGKSQVLKFRYTSYFGESHPAESKVTLEILLSNLSLTPAERHKLIILAGPRYNPLTDILKFSCELFPYRIQNKKYLNEQLHRLIKEAKDMSDTFEDIPQDFRHIKSKRRLTFPREWIKAPT